MKKLIGLLSFIIVLLSTGCPSPSTCKKGELRFEAPTFALGQKFAAPGQVYNNGRGLHAGINSITFSSGLKSFNYGEIISKPPHPFGTGQILRMNNTVLVFDLQQNTQKAEFEYLDEGGTINLGARFGANMYIGSMYTMPAHIVINGVKITKTVLADYSNPQGVKVAEKGIITLTFSSDIGSIIIGGQEMYLDNFCFN